MDLIDVSWMKPDAECWIKLKKVKGDKLDVFTKGIIKSIDKAKK